MIARIALACLVLTAACSRGEPQGSPTTEITVFAASSLTAVFEQLGARYEQQHPGTRVTFNFGSSTDLAAQIASEGTADVFASASAAAMDAVAAEPGIDGRRAFATNRMAVITPLDNPAEVTSLDSLTRQTVEVVLGAEGVPVGDYARELLTDNGILHPVLANVVSFEPDDASLVARIVAGEADASIVYTSDAATNVGAVTTIEIPERENLVATYPIGVVRGSDRAAAAMSFVDFVLGPEGRSTLAAFGFGPPEG